MPQLEEKTGLKIRFRKKLWIKVIFATLDFKFKYKIKSRLINIIAL